MTPEFIKWWNSDDQTPTNPYAKHTPIFWAWEGWVAGQKAEREACARLCEEGVDTEHPTVEGHVMKNFGASTHLANAIRSRGEK